MKSHVFFLLLVLFICACSLCSASPLITNGSVTTYIGENNYMYLESADGSLHRLQAPIRDLLGMDAQNLYCLTYDNKIYGVRLDGTSSSLVSAYATPEQINAYRPQPAYTLTDQLLTRASGQLNIALSGTCLAACSNQDAIFYIQQDLATSAVTLHAVPLDAQNVTFTTVLEGMRTVAPLSMTAAKDMVCVLGLDRSIHVYSIAAGALQTIEAAQVTDEIISAVCASGKILTSPAGLQMIMVSTAVPTFTPSPTPFIITPAPTVRPTATRRPTQVPDPDETIYYGTRGTRVRKMQQRLLNLGYPVGKVDGSFGEQTLFALNLFQRMARDVAALRALVDGDLASGIELIFDGLERDIQLLYNILDSLDQVRGALESLNEYCAARSEQTIAYRSWKTGRTLTDWMETLELIQSTRVDYLYSMVSENGMTLDKNALMTGWRYQLRTARNRLDEVNENISETKKILASYKNDEVYVSMQESDAMKETKAVTDYYNTLVLQMLTYYDEAAKLKTTIADYESRISRMEAASETEVTEAVRQELEDVVTSARDVYAGIRAHMEEIFQTPMYTTYELHSGAQGKEVSFLSASAKRMIIGAAAGAVIALGLWFLAALAPEFMGGRKNREKEAA